MVGRNLQALLDATADEGYGARVVAVGADRAGATGLGRAQSAGLPTFVCPVADFPTGAAGTPVDPDLRRSRSGSGDLRRLPQAGRPAFLAEFAGRYLNTHNALLPGFPGIHGPRDALAYGVKVAGATLFFVDAGVDTGPIIAQVTVPVLDDDTEETLPTHQGGRTARNSSSTWAGWSATAGPYRTGR